MELFRKGSKWSLPAMSLSYYSIDDLPLKVTSTLMFHHDVNDLVIATYPWLSYNLSITDLIRWKATLNDTCIGSEESFDCSPDAHFESFLRSLNAQKITNAPCKISSNFPPICFASKNAKLYDIILKFARFLAR